MSLFSHVRFVAESAKASATFTHRFSLAVWCSKIGICSVDIKYDQEYQTMDINTISEEKLNDPAEIEKIANTMVDNVDNYLFRAYQSAWAENRYDRSTMFSDTYINGVTVNQYLDEMYEENPLDQSKRAKIGSLLIARAMLEGDQVAICPVNSDDPEPVFLNSAFKDVALLKLNGWERFWSHFGLFKEKKKEVERRAHAAEYLKEELSAMQERTENITVDEQKAIVDKNVAYATEQAKLRMNFYDGRLSQLAKIDALYFGDVDPSFFENSIRSGFKLPDVDNFKVRLVHTITACVMMKKGHTLENICDPTYTIDRKEVGQYVAELSARIASKDPAVSDKASQELADIYVEGAKKYLAQPMPPKEELKDFLHSKRPLYLAATVTIGADIGHGFDHGSNSTRILSDPSNLILMDWLGIPSAAGVLGAINTVVQKKENVSEYNDERNPIGNEDMGILITRSTMERTLRCAHSEEGTDYSGSTIGDYALKNENKKTKDTAFDTLASTLVQSVFWGESNMPLKLEDFVTGQKSINEMMDKSAVFKSTHEDEMEGHDRRLGNGFIPEKFAKMDLAKKMVERMTQKMPELPEVLKGNLTKELYKNKDFQKLTADLSVEEVKGLEEKPAFFKKLVTEAAPKLPAKVQESVPVAPVSVVKKEPVKKDVGLGNM